MGALHLPQWRNVHRRTTTLTRRVPRTLLHVDKPRILPPCTTKICISTRAQSRDFYLQHSERNKSPRTPLRSSWAEQGDVQPALHCSRPCCQRQQPPLRPAARPNAASFIAEEQVTRENCSGPFLHRSSGGLLMQLMLLAKRRTHSMTKRECNR